MSNQETSRLESRVFKGYWRDGAIDLAAGSALTTMGVFWLTGPVVAQSLAPALAFIVYPILRKKVTEPRMGHVRFSEGRRSKLRLLHWLALALGVAALGIGIGAYVLRSDGSSDAPIARMLIPGLPAALVALMSLGGAVMLHAARFLAYTVVLLACGVAVVVADAHPGWALLGGGIVVVLNGGVLMIRFVHEYPIATPELE